MFLIPAQWFEDVVRNAPGGRCALLPFFPQFIAPGLANPDANVQARAGFVHDWWCQACTNEAGGGNVVRVAPAVVCHTGNQLLLNQHVARVKAAILTAVGVGGASDLVSRSNGGRSLLYMSW